MAIRSMKLGFNPKKVLGFIRPDRLKEISNAFDLWSRLKQDLLFLSSDRSFACRIRPDNQSGGGYRSEVWVKISHCRWRGEGKEHEIVAAVKSALQSTHIAPAFGFSNA